MNIIFDIVVCLCLGAGFVVAYTLIYIYRRFPK